MKYKLTLTTEQGEVLDTWPVLAGKSLNVPIEEVVGTDLEDLAYTVDELATPAGASCLAENVVREIRAHEEA